MPILPMTPEELAAAQAAQQGTAPAGPVSLSVGDVTQVLPGDPPAPSAPVPAPAVPPDAPAMGDAMPPPDAMAALAARPTPTDDYQLAALQAQAQHDARMGNLANVLESADARIGQRKVDHSASDEAIKQAQMPVEGLLKRREQLRQAEADQRLRDLDDINSPVSKRAQLIAVAKGMATPEQAKGLSAGMFGEMLKGADFEEARREHDLNSKRYADSLGETSRHNKAEEALGWAKLRQDKKDGASDKENARIDKAAEHLVTATAPIAKAKEDLATVDAAAAQKSIPGVGPIAGHVPGVVDDFLADMTGGRKSGPSAVQSQQAVHNLFVTLGRLNKRWNEGEAKNQAAAYGFKPGMSETDFREGVKKLHRDFGAELKMLEAGAPPEAVQRVKDRGGVTATDFDSAPAAPAAPETQAMQAHPQDAKALAWAKKHPKDPMAAQILAANGG